MTKRLLFLLGGFIFIGVLFALVQNGKNPKDFLGQVGGPTATIVATNSATGEAGNSVAKGVSIGTFLITLTGHTVPTTVNLTISGTATNGTDYQTISTAYLLPAPVNAYTYATSTFSIVPIPDLPDEGNEDVVVAIAPGTGYSGQSSDSVTIYDPPTISVNVSSATAGETGVGNGAFRIQRDENPGCTIEKCSFPVKFTIGGSATNGLDYITIPYAQVMPERGNGYTAPTVTIDAVVKAFEDDTLVEGSESVTLQLTQNPGYRIGTPNIFSITINDNDPGGSPPPAPPLTGADICSNYNSGDVNKPGNYPSYSSLLQQPWTWRRPLNPATDLDVGGPNADYTSVVTAFANAQSGQTIVVHALTGGELASGFDLSNRNFANGNPVHIYFVTPGTTVGPLPAYTDHLFGMNNVSNVVVDGMNNLKIRVGSTQHPRAVLFLGNDRTGQETYQTLVNVVIKNLEVDGGYYNGVDRGAQWGVFSENVTNFAACNLYVHNILDEHGFYNHWTDQHFEAVENTVDITGRTCIQTRADGVMSPNQRIIYANNDCSNSCDASSLTADDASGLWWIHGNRVSKSVGAFASEDSAHQWANTDHSDGHIYFYDNKILVKDTPQHILWGENWCANFKSPVVTNRGGTHLHFANNVFLSLTGNNNIFAREWIAQNTNYGPNSLATVFDESNNNIFGLGQPGIPPNSNAQFANWGYPPTSGTGVGNNQSLTVNQWITPMPNIGKPAFDTNSQFVYGAQNVQALANQYFGPPILCGSSAPTCNGSCGSGLICQTSGATCACVPLPPPPPPPPPTGYVNVIADDADAAEAGQNQGSFKISRTNTSGTLAVYFTLTGTAANGPDYTGSNGQPISLSRNFSSGQTDTYVSIVPVDDTTAEQTESVILTLTGTSDVLIVPGTQNNATVTIADNDGGVPPPPPPVSVSASMVDSSAGEPSNNGTFRITRTGATGVALSVNVTVTGSASNNIDFQVISSTQTIPGTSTFLDIPVTIIDDGGVEGLENVILTVSPGSGYSVGAPSSQTMSISDNDVLPSVTMTAVDSSVGEPNNHGFLRITRSQVSSSPLSVTISLAGSTATNGTDFQTISTVKTIPGNSASLDIPVTVIDDAAVEGSETVALSVIQVSGSYTTGTPASQAITITDDDPVSPPPPPPPPLPTVTVNVTGAAANETGPISGVIRLVRTGDTAAPLSVQFTLSGTAINGSDYQLITGTKVIAAGFASNVVQVIPIDDDFVENLETVILTLQSSPLAYTIGSANSGTVTIQSNDVTGPPPPPPILGDANLKRVGPDGTIAAAPTGTEAWVDADVHDTLNPSYIRNIPAGLHTAYATDVPGYDKFAGICSYPITGTQCNINTFPISLSLSSSSACNGISCAVTMTIFNGEVTKVVFKYVPTSVPPPPPPQSVVSLSMPDSSVGESSDHGSFRITVVPVSALPLSVTISLTGSTATNGSDFQTIGTVQSISANTPYLDIPITVVDDSLIEGAETVILTVSSGSGYTLGSPISQAMTISDDDTLAPPPPPPITPPPPPPSCGSATAPTCLGTCAGTQTCQAVGSVCSCVATIIAPPPPPGTPPQTPGGFSALAISPSQVRVAWKNVPDPLRKGYELEVSTNGTTYVVRESLPSNYYYRMVVGLTPGTPYFFRIRAYGVSVKSNASNVAVATTLPANTKPFTKPLYRGFSNPEVARLQAVLAANGILYPQGLVTGYYGILTETAVRRFQSKYGIPSVGVVGPITRAKLNFLVGGNVRP
ncbi:MAG: Calx-beta domain-containing protein [Patescibacteria group bacterium]